jgi:hypothetical protein
VRAGCGRFVGGSIYERAVVRCVRETQEGVLCQIRRRIVMSGCSVVSGSIVFILMLPPSLPAVLLPAVVGWEVGEGQVGGSESLIRKMWRDGGWDLCHDFGWMFSVVGHLRAGARRGVVSGGWRGRCLSIWVVLHSNMEYVGRWGWWGNGVPGWVVTGGRFGGRRRECRVSGVVRGSLKSVRHTGMDDKHSLCSRSARSRPAIFSAWLHRDVITRISHLDLALETLLNGMRFDVV